MPCRIHSDHSAARRYGIHRMGRRGRVLTRKYEWVCGMLCMVLRFHTARMSNPRYSLHPGSLLQARKPPKPTTVHCSCAVPSCHASNLVSFPSAVNSDPLVYSGPSCQFCSPTHNNPSPLQSLICFSSIHFCKPSWPIRPFLAN